MTQKLTTKRFLLRRFRDSDLDDVYKGLSHPEVIKYYGVNYDSLEAARGQIKCFSDLEQTQTGP